MSIKVLIADDHPLLRYGLAAYLEVQPDVCAVAQADDEDRVLPEIARAYPDILANRLTLVDGVPYTWDAEFAARKPGNLLSISAARRSLHSEVTALTESRHPERSVLGGVKSLP
jgi:DNA-binding NarL/FixJ family response regulator